MKQRFFTFYRAAVISAVIAGILSSDCRIVAAALWAPAPSVVLLPKVMRPKDHPAYFAEQAIVERLTSQRLVRPSIGSLWLRFGPWRPIHRNMSFLTWGHVAAAAAVMGIRWLHPSGAHDEIYQACGLVGAILKWAVNWNGILPDRVAKRLYLMMHVTKTRGEQAGGIAVFYRLLWARRIHILRTRLVKFKRAQLPKVLDRLMRSTVYVAEKFGARSVGNGVLLVLAHFRFGTLGPPAFVETHPHQFLPPRIVSVWRVVKNGFISAAELFSIQITHNGDFDWFYLFGKFRSNEEMGWYLERVLGRPSNHAFWVWSGRWWGQLNPLNGFRLIRQLWVAFFSGAGRIGDSPKLAAVLDFIVTQGMWDASARFAYQWSLAANFEEAFGGQDPNAEQFPEYGANSEIRSSSAPNGAPSQARVKAWGAVLESAFRQHQARLLPDGAASPSEIRPEVMAIMKADMVERMQALMTQEGYRFSDQQIQAFVDTSVHAFLHHDLATAVRWMLMRSKGSFGFAAISTLEPDKAVHASLGQPLTHGFIFPRKGHEADEEEGIYWLSEPDAAKVKIDADDLGVQYRLDLKNEIAEVMPHSIKYTRIADGHETTAAELIGEGRIVDLIDNDHISPLPDLPDKDLVGSDISQISEILAAIRAEWANPQNRNRETSREFFHQLLEMYLYKNLKIRISSNQLDKSPYYEEVIWQKAKEYASDLLTGQLTPAAWFHQAAEYAGLIRRELPPSSYTTEDIHKNDVDLFLSGIETSQWVGEHFAGRLSKMFPTLNIVSESSNKVLASLRDFDREHNILQSRDGHLYDFRLRVGEEKKSIKAGKRTQWLIVSQHGQTYASLNAAEKIFELSKEFGEDRVFVMTGQKDGAMGNAVGQSFTRTARLRHRVFVNGSGRRPAEASTVATLAADMTMAELLMDLSRQYLGLFGKLAMDDIRAAVRDQEPDLPKRSPENGPTTHADDARNPMRDKMTIADLNYLAAVRDRFVEVQAPALTGVDANRIPSSGRAVFETLVRSGRKWADHILEGSLSVWISWGLIGIFLVILQDAPAHILWPYQATASLFNFFFYTVFLRFGIPFGLRLAAAIWTGQVRQLFARGGKRTIAIADRPHVHELLNQYVSKLFSKAHKDQSVDVQSASSNDHFIHRMAHRVVRGTLIYIGFPDWDKASQQLGIEGSRMSGAQSKGIANGIGPASAGPEVVAVGENLQHRGNAMDVAINLTIPGLAPLVAPSRLAEELAEEMFGTMVRLTAGYVFFWALSKKVSSLWPFRWSTSQSQSGTRSGTTRSPVPAPERNGDHYQEIGLIEASYSEPLNIRNLLVTHEQSQGRMPSWFSSDENQPPASAVKPSAPADVSHSLPAHLTQQIILFIAGTAILAALLWAWQLWMSSLPVSTVQPHRVPAKVLPHKAKPSPIIQPTPSMPALKPEPPTPPVVRRSRQVAPLKKNRLEKADRPNLLQIILVWSFSFVSLPIFGFIRASSRRPQERFMEEAS